MMNILITTDRNYLQHAYVMLASLVDNNRDTDIDLYYLHCDLDPESMEKFRTFFEKDGLRVRFIKADEADCRGLYVSRHITRASYLRIHSAEQLPEHVDRVLYLDPDLVVKGSLVELYNTDLGDCYCGAVENPDLAIKRCHVLNIPREFGYFNSGVMLLDMRKFRNGRISEKALNFSRDMGDKLDYHDQDALNAVLYDKWFRLHPRWNVHTRIINIYRVNSVNNTREICEAVTKPVIIHYTGPSKPWEYRCVHPFRNEYQRYLQKTPFRKNRPVGFSFKNMRLKYKTLIRQALNRIIARYIPKGLTSRVPRGMRDTMVRFIFEDKG